MKLIQACVVVGLVLMSLAAFAHCDTLEGPVVTDARAALAASNVTPTLKWIRAEDTAAVTAAFTQTLAVRKLSPEAQALADSYFFETLVRLHRASEGEPYTGLQPAGAIEPIIVFADQAIVSEKVDPLVADITAAASEGIHQRFSTVVEARRHMNNSVEAGRKYVAAYVDYIHYVEEIHRAIAGVAPEGTTEGH